MDIIQPITFLPTMLTSSSLSETDYPVWASGTSYVQGNRVILTSTHRIYEALTATTGASPDVNVGGVSPKWLDIGPTNKYAAFDDKAGTQSVSTGSLSFTVTPGVIVDSIGFINMAGTTLHITSTVSGTTIYDRTIILQTDVGVYDWKTYFFAPIVNKTDAVITDLLPYANQVITITLSGPSTVAIGNISIGTTVTLGILQYNAKIGTTDYSKKDVDNYGNVIITKRAFTKRLAGTLVVENTFVDQLAVILANQRSTPMVWSGAGSLYTSMILWAFYKDFEIDVFSPELAYCTFTLEGLT